MRRCHTMESNLNKMINTSARYVSRVSNACLFSVLILDIKLDLLLNT